MMKRVSLILGLLVPLNSGAIDLYVAPNGDNDSAGTENSPLQTLEGARNRVRTLSKNQSIRVLFKAGTYRFDQSVSFGSNDSGTSANPIIYQSAPGETAFFDGGRVIDVTKFTRVTGSLANRIPASARGDVWSQVITDTTTRQLLGQGNNGLTFNKFLIRPTRSPNTGYFNMDREFSNGAFTIFENTNFDQIKAEVNRNPGQGQMFGYVRRQFDPYVFPIRRIAGRGNRVFELSNGDRFGFPGDRNDRLNVGPRVRILNMLATLDQAREWYFDTNDNRLYIYPPGGNIRNTDSLVVWGGEGAIDCKNASHIYFHNFVMQNFATTDPVGNRFNSVVSFDRGSNLRLRGSTLRHIAIPLAPFSIQHRAKNCLVDSCDIYDNARGSRLRGGGITTGSVDTGNNRVSNCHFTRVDGTSLGTAIGISGRGNSFTNNLVHNTSKQPITFFGFDNSFELNEIYNVCQDEGDGGAMYGGARLYSHGNRFRRNLLHHNIAVPGLVPRAGIYFDDFDAGNFAEENILYKAGAYGIYSNRGTSNTMNRNIVMKSFSGVRSGGGGRPAYDTCMLYLNRSGGRVPDQNIKENYIGRMLEVCGKDGWMNRVNSNNWRNEIDPFWTNRYASFGRAMTQYFNQETMIPFETQITNNFFADNTQNFQAPNGSTESGSRTFNLNAMVDPEGSLNFDWRSGQRPNGAPNTNSFRPGLITGTFRSSTPSQADYRRRVSQRFSNIPSYAQGAPYNRALANRNLYNSGRDVIARSQSGLRVREGDSGRNTPGSGSGSGGGNGSGGEAIDVGPLVVQDRYLYDFGTPTSPLENGYSRVSELNTAGYYRWNSSASGISSINRNSGGGAPNIYRDFNTATVSKTFVHQVVNGTWQIRLSFFDANSSHNDILVRAEGRNIATNIDLTPGQLVERFATVEVTDGTLNIEFRPSGGDFIINRIILTRQDTNNGELTVGTKIVLRGNNGRYVSGTNPMTCNSRSIGAVQEFTVVDGGGGLFVFRASNGRYVSSENGRTAMNANRTAIGRWERFTVTNLGDNQILIKGNNGRYVSSENGRGAMNCNRSAARGWERFTWEAR